MKITIHDQKLLTKCCEALITYTQTQEEFFKQLITAMDKRALNDDEAMRLLRSALRIEQIYFRVIPLLSYIDAHPEEFTGNKTPWAQEAERIRTLYQDIEKKYLSKLVGHSVNILKAYNVSHEPPRLFAADDKIEKKNHQADQRGEKNQKSVILASTALDHKQFKIATYIDTLREATKNRSYALAEPISSASSNISGESNPSDRSVAIARLQAAQLQVESFILAGRDIDRTLLNDLDVYAQQQYRMLVNQHEPINMWLEILTKATTAAQDSMRTVFHEVQVRQEQIDRAERMAVKIVVGVFCGPASNMVDPVFNVFKALSEGVLSGNSMTGILNTEIHKNDNSDASEQIGSFVQWVLKLKVKEDPISTIVKNLESNPPNTTLEWMKKYMDYKISGPKVFSEMFQMDTELWNFENAQAADDANIDPIFIIKAKRRELMEEYKLNTQEGPWKDHFSSQEYKKLYTKVKNDLWEHFTGSIDKIFNAYAAQYRPAQGLRDIVAYIKEKTFDDNKAGLASFDRANYEEVINTIANELKLAGLLRFAMTYDPYWGGSPNPTEEHLKSISDGSFTPEMNGKIGIERDWKTDLLNKAIYECYLKTQPGPAPKLHNPFIDFDRVDDFRCRYFKTRYTPQQAARFDKTQCIMHEYFFTPIDTRLIKSIESRLNKRGPRAPQVALLHQKVKGSSIALNAPRKETDNQDSLMPAVQAIDKIHEWKSAQSLYAEAKAILKPYITSLETDRVATREEKRYANTWLFSKINLLHSTKLNKHIEAVKAKSSPSPTSSKTSLGNGGGSV